MWCGVVKNVMFNTVKLLSIIFEWTTKNKQMQENTRRKEVICFETFGGSCMKKCHYRVDFSFEYDLSRFSK
jgi:hypothetical protein